MFKRFIIFVCLIIGAFSGHGQAVQATGEGQVFNDPRMREVLEPFLKKHKLPAMAAAIVTGQGLEIVGAVGLRKMGADIPVTVDDLWHLGSDTKAMTATMIGALVEKGLIKWETTVEEIFPDLPDTAPAALKKSSLLHLLAHRSGLPRDILWNTIPRTDSLREQRWTVLKTAAQLKVKAKPTAGFLYSNLGYVIAGAMAEKATDAVWEDLMKKLIFEPLGMSSVGFGGVGTPGELDQPWGHHQNGKPVDINGPDTDNPPVIGPAGTVHGRLSDWAKFIADQLRGDRGEPALLKPETYRKLHTPPFPGDYALGWEVAKRGWAGGIMLAHNGSNTMNFCWVFMAPARNFAILVVSNQGGEQAAKACDKAASAIITRFRR